MGKTQNHEKYSLKLFWEFLRRDNRYIEDYGKWKKKPSVQKEKEFCKKWGLYRLLDPALDWPYAAIRMMIKSDKYPPIILKATASLDGKIKLEINSQYSKKQILSEVGDIIDKVKPLFINLPEIKNIFDEEREKEASYYEDLLYVADLKEREGKSYKKILDIAHNQGLLINASDRLTIRDYYNRYKELKKKMPVPV